MTLADVVRLLELRYPPAGAESWDAPGTVCGDPTAPVERVMLAIDATAAVVDEALAWGADLLVTHHPLLMRPVHSVAATSYKGALVHRLIRGGCALHAAHTNADAVEGGVPQALAEAIGLVDLAPLVPHPAPELDLHVVLVPAGHTAAVTDALVGAGAGAVGEYTRCAWTTSGTGTFLPGPGARPAVGAVGEVAVVAEDRVEMVAPRRLRAAVVAAMRAAHPYEEPAFQVLEAAQVPGSTGSGRVGRLARPVSLEQLAAVVAAALQPTAQGVRVSGELAGTVERVAVLAGSGDSMFDAVRAARADVYVTADLRHHPASELRQRAAFEAGSSDPTAGRPYLIDVAHSASERPWLARAAAALEADVRRDHPGASVVTRVSELSTDPWTTRIASPTSPADPHRTPPGADL